MRYFNPQWMEHCEEGWKERQQDESVRTNGSFSVWTALFLTEPLKCCLKWEKHVLWSSTKSVRFMFFVSENFASNYLKLQIFPNLTCLGVFQRIIWMWLKISMGVFRNVHIFLLLDSASFHRNAKHPIHFTIVKWLHILWLPSGQKVQKYWEKNNNFFKNLILPNSKSDDICGAKICNLLLKKYTHLCGYLEMFCHYHWNSEACLMGNECIWNICLSFLSPLKYVFCHLFICFKHFYVKFLPKVGPQDSEHQNIKTWTCFTFSY